MNRIFGMHWGFLGLLDEKEAFDGYSAKANCRVILLYAKLTLAYPLIYTFGDELVIALATETDPSTKQGLRELAQYMINFLVLSNNIGIRLKAYRRYVIANDFDNFSDYPEVVFEGFYLSTTLNFLIRKQISIFQKFDIHPVVDLIGPLVESEVTLPQVQSDYSSSMTVEQNSPSSHDIPSAESRPISSPVQSGSSSPVQSGSSSSVTVERDTQPTELPNVQGSSPSGGASPVGSTLLQPLTLLLSVVILCC